MRTSMLKCLLFTAALASVAPTLACQPRVVLLNFIGTDLGKQVDSLAIIGVAPKKDLKEMDGVGQVLGYYDVSSKSIVVRYRACSGSDMLAYHEGSFQVDNDEVTIRLAPGIESLNDDPPPCPRTMTRREGGATDTEAGAGDDGGAGAGGAGGEIDAGTGGSAAGGAGGSAAGGAGVGGASGTDGGVTDTAECGTDTHPPVCDPPSGDAGAADVPDPPTISYGCLQYCSTMRTKCGTVYQAVYDSDDSCQRYCALAGWATTGDLGNSLGCRNMYLSMPAPPSNYCMFAGPNSVGNCGGACPNFCAAWIGICHLDPSEASACVDACMTKVLATNGAEPACRFQLLQRALYDQRYCDYVKFGSGSCFSCD